MRRVARGSVVRRSTRTGLAALVAVVVGIGLLGPLGAVPFAGDTGPLLAALAALLVGLAVRHALVALPHVVAAPGHDPGR